MDSEKMAPTRSTLKLIIFRRKEAMGYLGCPSKIVEELLTVILRNKVLKRRQSSPSREIAGILL
jgi:hypothetical protein